MALPFYEEWSEDRRWGILDWMVMIVPVIVWGVIIYAAIQLFA